MPMMSNCLPLHFSKAHPHGSQAGRRVASASECPNKNLDQAFGKNLHKKCLLNYPNASLKPSTTPSVMGMPACVPLSGDGDVD